LFLTAAFPETDTIKASSKKAIPPLAARGGMGYAMLFTPWDQRDIDAATALISKEQSSGQLETPSKTSDEFFGTHSYSWKSFHISQ
jgi:hypothetical protein